MKYKLLVLDVDGTLLNDKKEITPRTHAALLKAQQMGVHVVLASYGPQGRELRLPLTDPELNRKIEAFDYNGRKITNFEMESSSLAGLAALMGHRAMTVCCIIAGRVDNHMNTDYKGSLEELIETVLDRI